MQPRSLNVPKWLPYALPLVLFILITNAEQAGGTTLYPLIYTGKIAALTALVYFFRFQFPELGKNKTGVVLGISLGPILTAAWILIDFITPHLKFLGSRTAYDPFIALGSRPEAWLFILVRFYGLTLVAPIIEELFFRSFLLRWIVNPDNFTQIPLGEFNLTAFVAVVILMASAHPEYLAAAVFSAVMNLLLYKTKNLWATIAAHASTNFCLGVYVLWFHAWKYW